MATYTDNYNLVKPTMAESADIRTINGNMDSVDNIMHATQVSLAPAYDSTETYNTGDIVMYEFLMYECLDDGVTGTWDATKWQRTTAGEHGGGGGGSDVEITPTLQSGTKIADFEINGVTGALYAPSGGGGSDGVIEGLDYDRAETLTMPDFTGYTYTPTEDGVLMLKSYGSVGGVAIEATGDDTLNLAVLGDTWTCPWIPVNKSTEYTLKRMAQSSGFPSDSWLKFIPWKRGVFLAPMIYSTEEREVGVWVDDKPLYQKTYVLSSSININNSGYNITSLIDNVSDIEQVVGALFNSSQSSSEFGTEGWVGFDGDGVLWAYSAEGSLTDIITLRYTKSSDTAGSGAYGSLGVPMEHYDDTEKVVGTWFGDTVYEKSAVGNFSTGTLTVMTLDSNIDILVSVDASLYYPPTHQWLSLPYYESSDRVYMITNDNLVKIVSNSGMSAYTKYAITVRYTKVTT